MTHIVIFGVFLSFSRYGKVRGTISDAFCLSFFLLSRHEQGHDIWGARVVGRGAGDSIRLNERITRQKVDDGSYPHGGDTEGSGEARVCMYRQIDPTFF